MLRNGEGLAQFLASHTDTPTVRLSSTSTAQLQVLESSWFEDQILIQILGVST